MVNSEDKIPPLRRLCTQGCGSPRHGCRGRVENHRPSHDKTTGTLTAHLSDGSAPDYTDGSLGNTSTSWAGVYTLVFRSIDPNATLNVTWVQDTAGGDVNWSAAPLY